VKKLALFCSAIFLSAVFASAEVDWLTDFDAAKAKAKSDHKLVLLEFTGSDWCSYCKLMQAEVSWCTPRRICFWLNSIFLVPKRKATRSESKT
jgi:thioredoxin-related protein